MSLSSGNIPGNWQPINNVCIPFKILKKCVHMQLALYFENNRLFTNSQHGLHKGKATNTAVMELNRKLFDVINMGKKSSCLFLDFSRAFNTVDHNILLN